MRSFFTAFFFLICAAVSLPLRGEPIPVIKLVSYAEVVRPGDAVLACDWHERLISEIIKRSKGGIVESVNAPVQGFGLSLVINKLSLKTSAKESEYVAVLRANMNYEGKLVATRDFESDESFKNSQSGCEALSTIGKTLGENVSKWVSKTKFTECKDGCNGIHPDEPIAIGAEILIANADAINDTVRNECNWTTKMVAKVVSSFNESDPPPRAKLEVRPDRVESYAGRRLLLYVDDMHALGGGGFSGPKWLTMHGELRDGALLVASFESRSESGRGLTTCRSVDSLSDSTADMIVEWLHAPSLGAKLQ